MYEASKSPAGEDGQVAGPYLLVVRHLSDKHLRYLPWNITVVIDLPLPQHRNVSPNPAVNMKRKSEIHLYLAALAPLESQLAK